MAQVPELTGPSIPPANGGNAEKLVILLHGVGADGNDLIELAPYYQRAAPQASFISPNAPYPFDLAPFGYQWFSLQNMQPDTRLLGVQAAAPIVNALIDRQLEHLGLTESDLVLAGFSQGAMMALYVGLRREQQIAGIISHSGILVGENQLLQEIKSSPPVLLTHGAQDDVLPPTSLSEAKAALDRVGVSNEAHLLPALGHGIDAPTIDLGIRFLTQAFMD